MTNYLLRAAAILKININPLFLPAAIGILFFTPSTSDRPAGFIFLFPLIFLFIIYPLIYGRYVEIINDNRQISYGQIFSTHWFNFFVVSLILGIPILFSTILGLGFGPGIIGINQILSIIIDVLGIYIFPLVFLLRKRFTCIPLGIKCLLGNFNFSVPLVALTIIPSVLNSFIRYPAENAEFSLPFFLINYIFWLLSLIFDFLIFIAATLILKEKLLQP